MNPRAPGRDQSQSRLLDEYLVVCARDGDRRAFEALARRWNRRLTAHARRLLGEPEAARDAVQGAWLEIARGLARVREEAAFPAWAYRIVSRQCARRIAGARRDRALTGELAAQPEPAPESIGPDADREASLRRAIRTLPAAQRAAVALFYFEDLSVAETAVALDVAAGTVKTRLMHARRALKAAMDGDENA